MHLVLTQSPPAVFDKNPPDSRTFCKSKKVHKNKIPLLFLAGCFFLLSAAGCAGHSAVVSKDFHPGEKAEWAAVLPFSVEKGFENEYEIEKILRARFFETFSYLGYLDRNTEDIDSQLKKLGLYDSIERDNNLSPQKLGELLGADFLIYGDVKKAVNSNGIFFSETLISANLKMVEAKTGKVIWEKKHEESVLSSIIVPESAVKMIEDKAEHADTQKILNTIAEKFSREVVETIPDPSSKLAEDIRLPEIRAMDVRIEKTGGDESPLLRVAMAGDPAMLAAFDIGNWKTNIPMEETSPGNYEGSYTALPGDSVKGCLVVGKLKDKDGTVGTRIFRKQLVSLKF